MVLLTRSASKKRPTESQPPEPVQAAVSESNNSKPKTTSQSKPKNKDSAPESVLESVSKRLDKLCSSYDQFIIPDSSKSDDFKELTKSLYEYEQKALKKIDLTLPPSKQRSQSFKPLNSLFVKGFDNEQIWQQLDVFNKPFLGNFVSEISNLSSRRAPLVLNIETRPPKAEKSPEPQAKSILKVNEDPLPEKKNKKKEKTRKVKFAEKDYVQEFDVNGEKTTGPTSSKREGGNIDFFNLDEMEAFLDAEDRKEMMDRPETVDDKDDDIDYFADIPSDSEEDGDEGENGRDLMYSSFFDPPKTKGLSTSIEIADDDVEEDDVDDEEGNEEEYEEEDGELDTRDFDEDDMEMLDDDEEGRMFEAASDSDEDESNAPMDNYDLVNQKLKALANQSDVLDENDPSKSEFERSQLKLRQRIEKAERELLHPAKLHWQTAGETTGDARPENSLLEEHLQFDHVSKPAPMITDQTTISLESIIKQRIKDAAFDDVERKEKPNEKPFEFRRRIMLESEKSKVGLAEVYEQDYLKKQQQLKEQQEGNSSLFASAGEVEETETRKEIRRLMRGLFRKLDSLSAFHYTPRAPEPEVKIINNLPAITVEEVTPDTVSDMKLLAPEEVFNTRGKMTLQAKGERDSTDRKRARRLKKKKQSIKHAMERGKTKVRVNATNKVEIDKLKKSKKGSAGDQTGGTDKKAFSSSTKFFERLQETNETSKVQKRKKAKSNDPNLAKKLKL